MCPCEALSFWQRLAHSFCRQFCSRLHKRYVDGEPLRGTAGRPPLLEATAVASAQAEVVHRDQQELNALTPAQLSGLIQRFRIAQCVANGGNDRQKPPPLSKSSRLRYQHILAPEVVLSAASRSDTRARSVMEIQNPITVNAAFSQFQHLPKALMLSLDALAVQFGKGMNSN